MGQVDYFQLQPFVPCNSWEHPIVHMNPSTAFQQAYYSAFSNYSICPQELKQDNEDASIGVTMSLVGNCDNLSNHPAPCIKKTKQPQKYGNGVKLAI